MPKNMPLKRKYFDRLHERLLADQDYSAGYHYALAHRNFYEGRDLENLRLVTGIYLRMHSAYAAGVARVVREALWRRSTEEVPAA